MPVGLMLRCMSSWEITELEAFYRLKAEDREDQAEKRSKDVLVAESLAGVRQRHRKR